VCVRGKKIALEATDVHGKRGLAVIRDAKQLPHDAQTKISELIQALMDDHDLVALYAFGSLVNNALKPLSDLDFGILLNDRLNKRQRLDRHLELIGVFTDLFRTDEIDLINMYDAPERISFQILKTGRLLMCNDTDSLTNFREQVVKIHLDFKFARDAFDAAFLEGIGYHG